MFHVSFSLEEREYSAYAEQLDMPRFQGEEDRANALHNPHE
jgi:hypothetical protein